jgi:photosystem II stability/assembly factor-like uncharacterized protein
VPKARRGSARYGFEPGLVHQPDRPREPVRGPRTKEVLAHLCRTWSALILIGTLLLSSCSTSLAASVRSTTFSRAGCGNSTFGSLLQSMNGHVVGCLQVGVLDAGPHYVVLDQVVFGGDKGTGVTGTATTAPSPGAGGVAREPAVALSLSPVSGAPGSRITVTGRVTSPIPGTSADLGSGAHANLCWDGCLDGLQYQGVQLQWTSPTTFRATLVVPAAPWIERETDSVHYLASGTYPIGIQCIESLSGCAFGGSEGSTDFMLQVAKSAVTPWCRTDSSCAHLAVTPRRALPGEGVRVTGYAPLESVIGSDEPFTYQLQVLQGRPRGPEVKFTELAKGVGAVDLSLGHGALGVAAPPEWKSLPRIAPLAEIDAGLPSISADPADPSTVAWCGSGSVIVSGAGGQIQVPTASAALTLDDMGLAPLGTGGDPGTSQPTCVTALPLGAESDDHLGESPPVVVAAFVVAPDGEAPPTADVALLTTNDGQTWTPLPAPPGTDPTAFGGFRVQGQDIEALFSAATTGAGSPQPLVETSSDGGHTWQTASLSCPTEGPCVTLGAYAPGNCAMNGTSQSVLRSTNRGQSWTQIGWPATVNSCAPAELVATSPHTEFLVASASPYTLTRSIDSGTTWSDIGLPALPGEDVGAGLGLGPGGIILLPGGALLSTGEQGSSAKWELLRPGATLWCSVRGVSSAEQNSALYAQVELIGAQIWWLSVPGESAPVAHHLAGADLSC